MLSRKISSSLHGILDGRHAIALGLSRGTRPFKASLDSANIQSSEQPWWKACNSTRVESRHKALQSQVQRVVLLGGSQFLRDKQTRRLSKSCIYCTTPSAATCVRNKVMKGWVIRTSETFNTVKYALIAQYSYNTLPYFMQFGSADF